MSHVLYISQNSIQHSTLTKKNHHRLDRELKKHLAIFLAN